MSDSDALTARLRAFAALLLERRGAIVDWPDQAPEGLAMLPADLAGRLGCLEVVPLSARPDGPLPVNLASEFLEKVEPLLAAEPRLAAIRIPTLYLKQSDMAAPVARAFTWLNARVVVRQCEPLRVEYHTWYFRARLDSADRWEELVAVTVNALSGAAVAIGDPLAVPHPEAEPADAAGMPPTLRVAARAAAVVVEGTSAPFVSRLRGHQERDRKRLRDYYHALLREDRRRAERRGAPADTDKQAAKERAIRLELQRKLDELDERYALRLELEPLAAVVLDCPALAIRCEVSRRQARRTHALYWNALLKELEPLPCRRCGASGFSIAFADETVEPRCPACA